MFYWFAGGVAAPWLQIFTLQLLTKLGSSLETRKSCLANVQKVIETTIASTSVKETIGQYNCNHKSIIYKSHRFFLLFVLGQSVIYEAVRLITAWGISELVDPAVARIQKMVSNNSDNNNVRYTALCCIEKLMQTCSHLPDQRRAQGYLFCHDHFIRRI